MNAEQYDREEMFKANADGKMIAALTLSANLKPSMKTNYKFRKLFRIKKLNFKFLMIKLGINSNLWKEEVSKNSK